MKKEPGFEVLDCLVRYCPAFTLAIPWSINEAEG
ncbi:hypothetical protein SBDP1_240003 [Syntrophobacter sp. SbD1]|nr:hypothetical protein SBDP1_240003 [Syntrophobacter sp. SbD1]